MEKNTAHCVSSTSVLRMLCTLVKPTKGRNKAAARSPVTAASFSARATGAWGARAGASDDMSDLLDVRPAEDALRQEDQGDSKNGKYRDVLIVDRKIRRPHGLDQADQQPADDGARQRTDAAQHGGGEGLDAGHE